MLVLNLKEYGDFSTLFQENRRLTGEKLDYTKIISRLESLADPVNVAGMARYGIRPARVYGVAMPELRKMAREIGKDHTLAQRLWRSGFHEARILAALVDDPRQVTEVQMERWAAEFDSWAVCDTVCGSLFDRTPFAWKKALKWSASREEYVKRAGFALMAWLAVHDKQAGDKKFYPFLKAIRRAAEEERNLVKKAVNWALRQIGKRNVRLHALAIAAAREMHDLDSREARWIAGDALRELTGKKVLEKIQLKR